MNLKLLRKSSGLYGIFGELSDENGKLIAVTLEHAYAEGAAFVPKLACGKYTCKRYDSPEHHYELFVVQGVPDFQGSPVSFIEIHIGNFNADSKGCILVGLSIGQICVLDSRKAFDQFMALQEGVDEFALEVS